MKADRPGAQKWARPSVSSNFVTHMGATSAAHKTQLTYSRIIMNDEKNMATIHLEIFDETYTESIDVYEVHTDVLLLYVSPLLTILLKHHIYIYIYIYTYLFKYIEREGQ